MRRTRLGLLTWLAALTLPLALAASARADVTFLHRAPFYATDAEPDATGRAFDYETFGYPFDAGLAVRVRDIVSTDTVDVLLNGEYIATITLTDGSGEVELMGLLGQDVPVVNRGDVVDIVNSDDGTVLLEGAFD
jgi:hypothetical protein